MTIWCIHHSDWIDPAFTKVYPIQYQHRQMMIMNSNVRNAYANSGMVPFFLTQNLVLRSLRVFVINRITMVDDLILNHSQLLMFPHVHPRKKCGANNIWPFRLPTCYPVIKHAWKLRHDRSSILVPEGPRAAGVLQVAPVQGTPRVAMTPRCRRHRLAPLGQWGYVRDKGLGPLDS